MILVCIKIFLARICDVSIGTFRTILTVRGKSRESSLLAFFEVLIWFYVAREALNISGGILIPVSYSLGYATGTFIGSYLSKKFIKGFVCLNIVTLKNDLLVNTDYKYSTVKLIKTYDNKKRYLIIVYIGNRELKQFLKDLVKLDKDAFYTISDVKEIY